MCRFQISDVQILSEPEFLELKNEQNFIKLRLCDRILKIQIIP